MFDFWLQLGATIHCDLRAVGELFAGRSLMDYNIALLQLIKNQRGLLQNYQHLAEVMVPLGGCLDDFLHYLKHEESFFYHYLCTNKSSLENLRMEVGILRGRGVQFTYPGDPLYPASFLHMPGAPLLFSFRGHPAWQSAASLAVVGSRDMSQLSRLWMEENFREFLRTENAVVVSGGARGVDQMAHQLALRSGRPTIVALPSGLDQVYPSTLIAWQTAIVDGGGCLLSEYEAQQKMKKYFFHDRNRLIAGLGNLTLLIEARRRSGSLLTAYETLVLGKSVLVIPGHPSEGSHLGSLDLLADGATAIRDANDLRMYFQSEIREVPGASYYT